MPDILLKTTITELCEYNGISQTMVVELVEHGIARPVTGETIEDWEFDITSTHWLKKAIRLYHDLEIDWHAVALLIELLQKNEELQSENQRLQEKLGRFLLDE